LQPKLYSMAEHNELGKWGEEKASEYLANKGFRILERDWRIGHRDIDIIAIDGDELVFVEVKTRRNNYFMEPELSVNMKKMRSISLAANAYAKMHYVEMPIRFDIVTVLGMKDSNCQINHIDNAFIPMQCWRR